MPYHLFYEVLGFGKLLDIVKTRINPLGLFVTADQ